MGGDPLSGLDMAKHLCAFLVLTLSICGTASAKTISVAVFDYPPIFVLGDDENPGYCFEIIEKIFEARGYQVEKHELPLARAIRSVETGAIDMICTINPHNSWNLVPAYIPNVSLEFLFWKRADDDFEFGGIDTLADRTVLNIVGFNYRAISPMYQAFLNSDDETVLNLSGEAPMLSAFRMIDRGNADVICLDEHSATYLLNKLGLQDRIVPAGGFQTPFLAYPAVGPNHPRGTELLREYEAGYEMLRQTGFVEKVVSKYLDGSVMPIVVSGS